jgi:hypothetical protein
LSYQKNPFSLVVPRVHSDAEWVTYLSLRKKLGERKISII